VSSQAGAADRVPSLDGVRACGVSLLLFNHVSNHLVPDLPVVIGTKGNAPRMFFISSGFLIASILLREKDKTGKLALGKFLFRRTMRIFPALYVYVAVAAALSALGLVALHHGDVLAAVTFTMNYHPSRAWLLGHTWSMSVQEQFYFAFPVVVLLFGVRGSTWAAIFTVAASPLARVASRYLFPDDLDSIGETLPTVADAMATGVLLAALRGWLDGRRWYVRLQASPWMGASVLLAFAARAVPSWAFRMAIGETLQNVAMVLWIDWCIRNPRSVLGRALNTRPVVWLGTISYSVYLYQQLFQDEGAERVLPSTAARVALVFAVGALSYYLVEGPAMRLRAAWERRLFRTPTPAPERPGASAEPPSRSAA
jgi:peptidoglycan/LPS O-acetylase OafA/YrhL